MVFQEIALGKLLLGSLIAVGIVILFLSLVMRKPPRWRK